MVLSVLGSDEERELALRIARGAEPEHAWFSKTKSEVFADFSSRGLLQSSVYINRLGEIDCEYLHRLGSAMRREIFNLLSALHLRLSHEDEQAVVRTIRGSLEQHCRRMMDEITRIEQDGGPNVGLGRGVEIRLKVAIRKESDEGVFLDARHYRRSRAYQTYGVQPVESRAVETEKPEVFICHAKADVDFADKLYDALALAGASPWMDKRNLVLGDDWQNEIKKAVARATAFVVCLRSKFDEVGFRQQEVRWALDALNQRSPGKGFVIPCLIEPCSLPDWCKPFHAGGDLSKPTEFADVIHAVGKHTGVPLQNATRG